MKRSSLILSIFLLGVMLVSCGTTLKKTSGKNNDSVATVMEKTKTPIYQEETRQITFDACKLAPESGIFVRIAGEAGTVESKAEVKVKVLSLVKEDSLVAEYQVIANEDGSFEIDSDKYGYISGTHKIVITAQAPGKDISDPLTFIGNIPEPAYYF